MSINISNRRIIMTPALAVGGGAPSWAQTAIYTNGAIGFQNPFFTNLAVNAGMVVVGVGGSNQGTASVVTEVRVGSSSGVGGTLLTKAIDNADTAAPCALWYGTVASGGTQEISVKCGAAGSWQLIGIGVGTLSNLGSSSPTSTASADFVNSQNSPYPTSSAVTVPSGGFAIVFCFQNNIGSIGVSGSTFTLDAQSNVTSESCAIGNNSTPGTVTPSFTGFNFATAGIVAATWA